jgi:hypothetical protein
MSLKHTVRTRTFGTYIEESMNLGRVTDLELGKG